jgi:hypothetical protein
MSLILSSKSGTGFFKSNEVSRSGKVKVSPFKKSLGLRGKRSILPKGSTVGS